MKQFTRVKGISEVRRLPRINKIRLGVKVKKNKKDARCKHNGNELCMFCSYPKETDYFVVPPEVQKVYGEHPKELKIMFPVNDPEIFFPQAYKFYGMGKGVKCIGDGQYAREATDDGFKDKECPCQLLDVKKCNLRAHLLVILPDVNIGGVYQIDIGSFNSIVDINSGIDYVRGIVNIATGIDRIALLPLRLTREPKVTYGAGSAQTHYTLKLYAPEMNLAKLDTLRLQPRTVNFELPPAEDINPVFDDGPVIDDEPETTKPQITNGSERKKSEPEYETEPDTDNNEPPEGSVEWYFDQAKDFHDADTFKEWLKTNAIIVKGWSDSEQNEFRTVCDNKMKALKELVTA